MEKMKEKQMEMIEKANEIAYDASIKDLLNAMASNTALAISAYKTLSISDIEHELEMGLIHTLDVLEIMGVPILNKQRPNA